jgi:hypothetical protein
LPRDGGCTGPWKLPVVAGMHPSALARNCNVENCGEVRKGGIVLSFSGELSRPIKLLQGKQALRLRVEPFVVLQKRPH